MSMTLNLRKWILKMRVLDPYFLFFFFIIASKRGLLIKGEYIKKKSSEKLKTNSSDLERSDETAWNKIKFQKDNKCYCEKHLFKYSPFVCRAENSGIFFFGCDLTRRCEQIFRLTLFYRLLFFDGACCLRLHFTEKFSGARFRGLCLFVAFIYPCTLVVVWYLTGFSSFDHRCYTTTSFSIAGWFYDVKIFTQSVFLLPIHSIL